VQLKTGTISQKKPYLHPLLNPSGTTSHHKLPPGYSTSTGERESRPFREEPWHLHYVSWLSLHSMHSALPTCQPPFMVRSLQLVEVRPNAEEEEIDRKLVLHTQINRTHASSTLTMFQNGAEPRLQLCEQLPEAFLSLLVVYICWIWSATHQLGNPTVPSHRTISGIDDKEPTVLLTTIFNYKWARIIAINNNNHLLSQKQQQSKTIRQNILFLFDTLLGMCRVKRLTDNS